MPWIREHFQTNTPWPDLALLERRNEVPRAHKHPDHNQRGRPSRNTEKKLLSAYFEFWRNWPDLPDDRILIPVLSLIYGQNQEATESIAAFLTRVKFIGDGVVLPRLPEITLENVRDWIQQNKRVQDHLISPNNALMNLPRLLPEGCPALPLQRVADTYLTPFLDTVETPTPCRRKSSPISKTSPKSPRRSR